MKQAQKEVNGVLIKSMTLEETFNLLKNVAEEAKNSQSDSDGKNGSDIAQTFLSNCPGLIFRKNDINTMTTFELWEVWIGFTELNPPFRFLNSYYETLLATPVNEVINLLDKYIPKK